MATRRTTPVLRNITLVENEPVITGLWGRNGSGKTTLMKLLAGHQRPDQGSIKFMGLAPYNNEQAVQHLCYMLGRAPLQLVMERS